jgi:hypothetical protein
MFVCLSKNEECLRSVCSASTFTDGGTLFQLKAQGVQMDKTFWTSLRYYITLLEPIVHLTFKYESDSARISDVWKDFTDLITLFDLRSGTDRKFTTFHRVIKDRWDTFLKAEVHAVAYMLDPRYYGSGLHAEEQFMERRSYPNVAPNKVTH